VRNLAGILAAGNYEELGRKKLQRLEEYVRLFPEWAGQFVFIGDDGQADLAVAGDVLSMVDLETNIPLFAFVAIKAVCDESGFVVPHESQQASCEKLRAAHPPVSPVGQPKRHRFFYFSTYEDLAQQLAASHDFGADISHPGWISQVQCERVLNAADRDRAFGTLLSAVRERSLLDVAKGLHERYIHADELDQFEMEELGTAIAAAPSIAAAHVMLPATMPASFASYLPEQRKDPGFEITVFGLNDLPHQLFLSVQSIDGSSSWDGPGLGLTLDRDACERLHNHERLVVHVYGSSSSPSFMSRGPAPSSYYGCFFLLLQPPAGPDLNVLPAASPTCSSGGAQADVSLLEKAEGETQLMCPREVDQVAFCFRWLP
jgi:hypothetical protein